MARRTPTRTCRFCGLLLGILLAGQAVAEVPGAASATRMVELSFDADPQWEGFRNRLLPAKRHTVRQEFGYRKSNLAGGRRAGEIGGRVQRAPIAATYAMPIAERTLNDALSASGTFAVPAAEGGSGLMIGWFRDRPQGWRTPSAVAMRLDGNGAKFWVFYEYGTQSWSTGGGGAFEGEAYQRTPTPPFKADGAPHRWQLDYDPTGAEDRGLLRFRIDDRSYQAELAAGHRQEGATFNRFGIWNVQTPGAEIEAYFDDLVVDGRELAFDQDPQWEKLGNPAEYVERVIRPYHDFGFSPTHFAGKAGGEIGGIIFRDEQPAYFAADAGSLSLDDELRASGKLTLRMAASDSGVYLGWFDSASKQAKDTPDHVARQKNFVGAVIEGPSRVGHYFRPGYGTRTGGRTADLRTADGQSWKVLRPNGSVHDWALHYRPQAAGGRGRIDVTLDGATLGMDLAEGDRQTGAAMDRFGIFNLQSGGHHVELYLDDVQFSRR